MKKQILLSIVFIMLFTSVVYGLSVSKSIQDLTSYIETIYFTTDWTPNWTKSIVINWWDTKLWIWTSSPSYMLHVNWWNIYWSNNAYIDWSIWIWTTSVSKALHVYDDRQNAEIDIQSSWKDYWAMYQNASSWLTFWHQDTDNLLTLTNWGKIWIWTTTPWAVLDVYDWGRSVWDRFISIWDDSYLTDVDQSNVLWVYGNQDPTKWYIKFWSLWQAIWSENAYSFTLKSSDWYKSYILNHSVWTVFSHNVNYKSDDLNDWTWWNETNCTSAWLATAWGMRRTNWWLSIRRANCSWEWSHPTNQTSMMITQNNNYWAIWAWWYFDSDNVFKCWNWTNVNFLAGDKSWKLYHYKAECSWTYWSTPYNKTVKELIWWFNKVVVTGMTAWWEDCGWAENDARNNCIAMWWHQVWWQLNCKASDNDSWRTLTVVNIMCEKD